jgi:hypothetical protein
LAGLILEHASQCGLSLPAAVAEELRRSATETAANNMRMLGELERIVGAFNARDVPVMLLKGAALNLTVYTRPDLRPMSDLDLLIRPENAGDALRLLQDHGCRRGPDVVREGFFPKYHYEVELFTSSPIPTRIDLHARALRPLRLSRTMPAGAFWENARRVRVGEGAAFVPCAEHTLIHLAAHAAFHGCGRLLWLYDIKRFTDHVGDSLDWLLVARRARDWRLSLPVLRAIERTEALFGSVCPTAFTNELAGHRTTWRDRLTLAQAPRDAASPMAHIAVNLLCTPGLRFRVGYLGALLRPGRTHLAGIYPWRHWGWVGCAHLWRLLRAIARVLCTPLHRGAYAGHSTA